ncbi:MAG TPA: hypothetical protein VFK79_09500 [Xanthobacteraceae bacterium]|nr:hypothetical protein [Xanthobacteraceae bacterium]
MASETLPAERLRQYLGELKPEARALLIAELERSLLRGDEMPGADLVLQELRRTMRDSGQSAARTGDAARAFFLPLEPFIVDDAPVRDHPGRIPRAALEPIWAWISRDLLPAEAKKYSDEIGRALIAGDNSKAEALTRAMQDQVAEAMDAAFSAGGDDRASRRLAGQISIVNGVDAAREVLALLKSREALAAFGAQLPGHFNTLADGRLQHIKTLLDAQLAKKPEIFQHALVLVKSRLSISWQLIRLATKAAESDKAARVAATPFSAAVNIVLAEVERLVSELKADLKSGRGVAVIALLKVIHDSARGLRTEMDLSVDSAWGRRLAAIRTEVSNLLKAEIESAPGRMRRLLRPRPAKEITAGSSLDSDDVAEVEALVGFVDACRKYAGELALNEMTLRSFSEMQQYLETGSQALLDGLRNAAAGDRRFRQSQLEAAARFGGKIFGPDYAATLSKAAELALAANIERKAAAR